MYLSFIQHCGFFVIVVCDHRGCLPRSHCRLASPTVHGVLIVTKAKTVSLIAGDEMFTDIYKIKETGDGFFIEVEGTVSVYFTTS